MSATIIPFPSRAERLRDQRNLEILRLYERGWGAVDIAELIGCDVVDVVDLLAATQPVFALECLSLMTTEDLRS